MKNNWIYAKNTFEANTRKSFKKMLTLSFDHFAKLSGAATTNPALVPLRDDYAPLHQTYSQAYSDWTLALGNHEAETCRLAEWSARLNQEVRDWEGQVRFVFAEGTAQEVMLFPHKRVPFQSGTYEQRIMAVLTLATQLATFTTQPVLLTLSATVQAFYDQMQAVRLAQTGLELSVSRSSRHLEQSRLACARGMFSNLGRLMHLMSDRPQGIGQFWELHLLRPVPKGTFADSLLIDPQTIASADLSAKQREKLTANTRLTIKNSSPRTVSLFVGFSTEPQAASPHAVELLPNEARELSASELGWSTTHTYLTAHNPHDQTATLSVLVKW
jgi:hypothetical protein